MNDCSVNPADVFRLHLPETDTTMRRLRCPDLWNRPEPYVLLTTDFQTAGHGQRGTVWEAERGKNLLFGVLFRPCSVSPSRQFLLSEALALAVAEALERWVEGVEVKWPNDVYVGDRKICGMLLEHDLEGMEICRTLVGVGINVNQRQFRGDAPNPVSLCQLIHKETDREVILQDLLCHFFRHLHEASSEEGAAVLHTAYLHRLYRRRGFHRFRDADGVFEAAIADVKFSGELVLRRRDGSLRAYWFKEVQFERE